MCVMTTRLSFGAGATLDEGTYGLRMLTAQLWDSVSRVADGVGPDREDERVLRKAALVLRGQIDVIRYVEADAAGADLPKRTVLGLETLIELIRQAATQLRTEDDLVNDVLAGVGHLADGLEAIATGDRKIASRYDALLERVSLLAEQLPREADEKVAR